MPRTTLILIAILSFSFAACGSPTTVDTTSTSAPELQIGLEKSADEVKSALQDLNQQLWDEIAPDHDMGLAWSDFEGDVRSVVDDLVRDPTSVDIRGMQQRVTSFETVVADSTVSLPTDLWENFVSAFAGLVEEVESA